MPEALSPNPEQGEYPPQERLLDAAAQLTDEFGTEVYPDDPLNHRKYLNLSRGYYPQEWLERHPQYDTISVNHHLGAKDPDDPATKQRILTLAFKPQEGVGLPDEARIRLFVYRTDEGKLIVNGVNGYRARKVTFSDDELAAFADNFDRATGDLRVSQATSAQ